MEQHFIWNHIGNIFLLRVREVKELPINSHIYMGCLDDIQTALRPLKKIVVVDDVGVEAEFRFCLLPY